MKNNYLLFPYIASLFLLAVLPEAQAQGFNVEMTAFLKIEELDENDGIYYNNNYLYIIGSDVNWNSGFFIVDVSDEENPDYVGFVEGNEGDLAFSGSYMYSAYTALHVFNLSNPEHPIEAANCPVSNGFAEHIKIQGNYAYLGCYEGGLSIINITNPQSPTEVGFWDAPNEWFEPDAIDVVGNYAYIAAYDGLYIINVSNPANPTLAGTYSIPGWPSGIDVSGNFAYVGYSGAGLQILNVANPFNISQIGNYFISGTGDWGVNNVYLTGNNLFVCYEYSGFWILNIANPSTPLEIGCYDTPFSCIYLALSGDYAFVIDEGGWLEVYDCSQAINYIGPGGGSTPSDVSLLPPSPNPFNSETMLSYTLSSDENISLVIYDINGRLVDKIAEEFQTAGKHDIRFGDANFPSGVYFARLQAGGFSQTQKLLLIK